MTVLDLARESEPGSKGAARNCRARFSIYQRNRTKRRGGNGTS